MKLSITADECTVFTGGWGYSAKLMSCALGAVEYEGRLSILEFGAGQGTLLLAGLLEKVGAPFRYVSYENNPDWVCPLENVETVLWEQYPKEILPGPYDLIIIDGPRGARTGGRLPWFSLTRPVVRVGTILAVDDFDHNVKYQEKLDENFSYEPVGYHPLEVFAGENWRAVRVLGVK